MCQHDALRFAGGPGRKNDRRGIVGVPGLDFPLDRPTVGLERPRSGGTNRGKGVSRHAGNRFRRDLALHQDEVPQRRQTPLPGDPHNLFQLRLVLHDRHGTLGEAQDERELLRGAVVAARNIGGAEAENRKVRDKPFLAVLRYESHV